MRSKLTKMASVLVAVSALVSPGFSYAGMDGISFSFNSGTIYKLAMTYDGVKYLSTLNGNKENVYPSEVNSWFQSNDRPATEIILDRVSVRMDAYPIKLSTGQNVFKQKLYTDYDRCSRKKFSFSGDIDVILQEDKMIKAFFESLHDPFVYSFRIDGTYDAQASVKLKPSIKVVGKCVRLGKESINLNMKPIPMDFIAEVVVSLNPQLLKPADSASGKYEIFVNPTAMITFAADPVRLFQMFNSGEIQSYYPQLPDPKAIATDALNRGDMEALSALLAVGIGDYLNNKLNFDLGWLTSGGSVQDFVKNQVLAVATQSFQDLAFRKIEYKVEPGKLGGWRFYVLPTAAEIYANSLVSGALRSFRAPGINCFSKGDSEVLFADMLYMPSFSTLVAGVCAQGVQASLIATQLMN